MNFDEQSIIKKRKALAFYNMRKEGTFYTFIFRIVLLLFLIFFLAGLGLSLGFVRAIHHNTPVMTIDSLTPDGEASILYDNSGEKIISLKDKDRKQDYISLKQIPQSLQNAVICLEDPEYYEHSGIDVYSVLNGFLGDLTSETLYGKTSLITQQLIENMDPDFSVHTNIFSRMEYRLRLHYQSLSLEANASKPEILEYYLNTISFGNGIIGVESAAQIYFDKSVSDLTLSESAILAAAITDPEQFDPFTEQEANKAQRILILEKMNEEHYITDEALSEAIRENSYEKIQDDQRTKEIGLSSFEQEALSQLYHDMNKEYQISSTKFFTMLSHGGLKIYTTQNADLQKKAESIINDSSNYSAEASDADACVTILNQANGQVQAIVGNRGNDTSIVNQVTDRTHQPGTLFHVLATYLPGIDSGTLTLASTYEDAPYQYLDNKKDAESIVDVYQGLTTIRSAIPSEMNIIAARAQSDVTAQKSYDYLVKLGFRHLVESSQDSNGNFITDIQQSICNGNLINGITNMEVTQAVSTLGNEGYLNLPILYTRVTNKDNLILLEKETITKHPIQSTTAFLITDALKQDKNDQIKESETAGLKGTALDNTAYWYTGYTPELTATVWVGYDDNRPFQSDNTEQKIWKKIMSAATDSTKNIFIKPSDLETADICTESGKLAVSSICDHDPRGNRILTEYFAPDTVPTTTCNTHVEVTICKESGMLISNECPKKDYIRKIYLSLPSNSSSTLDSAYVLPEKYASDERCRIHGKKNHNGKESD
ncbi:MAG: transglycosylase domain-containing protein [Lachnospiraceae bacterium]|nr:transglycosylase domain-containing protein [Lachnospiraceae bacterium]